MQDSFIISKAVTEELTAINMGSGDLEVFATPAMVAVMEAAASACAVSIIDDSETTVGSEISVKHLRPTAIGVTVTATAVLKSREKNRLYFDVKASDNNGEIGNGTHTRVVVNKADFMQRLAQAQK